MTETQDSICAWADATFGPAPSHARLAARANRELAELLDELAGPHRPMATLAECADVAILLCRLGHKARARLAFSRADNPHKPRRTLAAELAGGCLVRMGIVFREATLMDMAGGVTTPSNEMVAGFLAELLADLDLIAGQEGSTLQIAVDAKMAVNRERRWVQQDGRWHHEREAA